MIELRFRPNELDDISKQEAYALGFEFCQIYFALDEKNEFEDWTISLLNLRRAQELADKMGASLWFRIINDELAEISTREPEHDNI